MAARVEAHDDRFGLRGVVLAMLGQLKQVCNSEICPARGGLLGTLGQARAPAELLGSCRRATRRSCSAVHAGSSRTSPSDLAGRSLFHGSLNATSVRSSTAFASPEGPAVLVVCCAGGARSQPAGREPRLPLRPLVEPRRGAGRRTARTGSGRRNPQGAPLITSARSKTGSTSCSNRSASSSPK